MSLPGPTPIQAEESLSPPVAASPAQRRSRRIPLNTLRHFVTVGRLGSVRKAAEEMQISPAAVSQQIRKLEADLGGELFYRHIDGMVLTRTGCTFLETCQRALSEIDKAAGQAFGAIRREAIRGGQP